MRHCTQPTFGCLENLSRSHWLEIEESDDVLVGVVPEHQALPLGDGTDLSPHYLRYITEVPTGIRKIEILSTFFPGRARSD